MPCQGPGPINQDAVNKANQDIIDLLRIKYGILNMPQNFWISKGEYSRDVVLIRLADAVRMAFECENFESF